MSYSFSKVPTADIPRSAFNRSHGHKTTFDSGFLVPFYVDEALPGDTFKVDVSVFARLATPIVPIMDNMHMDVFFFAVPNRLIWDKWQRFMGEQANPGDSIDFTIPQVVAGVGGFGEGTIFDYMGIPPNVPNLSVSALWTRAYNLIWNEWFRDENLQNSVVVDRDDGPDDLGSYSILKRGKRHDYFTSCLPWPQKGPGVELPLGGVAPVGPMGDGYPTFKVGGIGVGGSTGGAGSPLMGSTVAIAGDAANVDVANWDTRNYALQWGDPKLGADLSQATATTINSLRQAFQVQKLLERDARGGTRYTEILRSHFGVVSPDARLQRPEYLGGGSVPVIINPVPQNSSTDTTSPQGNLAGYGLAGGSRLGYTKSFVEHCVIVGLVMVRADLSYQQGLPRMFSRKTRYDFYWPAFSHLGEQVVFNKEIYAQGTAADEQAFGYQERWAEYRYFPSKITAKFRSTATGTLDFWHLAQKFETLPVLAPTFIEENPPVDRVIAVQDEPQFIFDSHFRIQAVRPMPTYSVPGLVDHF